MHNVHVQVAYCEEQVECRRVILLSHFGETNFTAAGCHKTCDVCQRNEGAAFENKDMTQVARDMIQVCKAHVQHTTPSEPYSPLFPLPGLPPSCL